MLENYVTCRATCVSDEFKMDDIDDISLQCENVHINTCTCLTLGFSPGVIVSYRCNINTLVSVLFNIALQSLHSQKLAAVVIYYTVTV